MKFTIIIFFVFISVQSIGQNWHLNKINETSKYSFEYWFQFENKDDTCSYQLSKTHGNQTSVIELYDNQGTTITFANITIKNIENDSIINLNSDFNGQSNIQLEKGKYIIQISAINHDEFDLQLEIDSEQFFKLKVILGLAPKLLVYQINSREKLFENEIIEIMECVKMNKKNFCKSCSNRKKYLIMTHI